MCLPIANAAAAEALLDLRCDCRELVTTTPALLLIWGDSDPCVWKEDLQKACMHNIQ